MYTADYMEPSTCNRALIEGSLYSMQNQYCLLIYSTNNMYTADYMEPSTCNRALIEGSLYSMQNQYCLLIYSTICALLHVDGSM